MQSVISLQSNAFLLIDMHSLSFPNVCQSAVYICQELSNECSQNFYIPGCYYSPSLLLSLPHTHTHTHTRKHTHACRHSHTHTHTHTQLSTTHCSSFLPPSSGI